MIYLCPSVIAHQNKTKLLDDAKSAFTKYIEHTALTTRNDFCNIAKHFSLSNKRRNYSFTCEKCTFHDAFNELLVIPHNATA